MDIELIPEYQLIAKTIYSGVIEKDFEYFKSNEFKYHCNLIGWDENVILEMIKERYEDFR